MRIVAGIGCILVLLLTGYRTGAQILNLGPADTSVCNNLPFWLNAGTGFASYQWSSNTNNSSADSIQVSASGEYSVTVTDTANNIQVDSIYVTINSSPIAVFLDNNACLGDSIVFIQLSKHIDSIATWLWKFGDNTTSNDSQPSHIYAAPGIYNITLYLTTVQGCEDSVTNRAQVYGLPYVSAGPNDTIDVNLDTAQLNGVTLVDEYSWEPSQYLLDSTVLNPLAVVSISTQFVLTVTDSLGCMNSDTMLVFVNQYPTTTDATININAGSSVVVYLPSYDTDPNGEPLTPGIIIPPINGTAVILNNDSIQYTPDAHFTGADTIIYQVCNTGDPPLCSAAYIYITVSNIPPIVHGDSVVTSINVTDTFNVLVNDTDPLGQQLTVSSLGTPLNGTVTDLSNQGNGLLSYTPNEGFSGTDSFYYVVCNNGSPALCDTGYVYVTVLKQPLKISNSFSPNGDGILDYFIIEGITAYPNNHLLVFSRWGDRIFEETGYNNDWNGKSGFNQDVPDGIYYYTLDLGDRSKILTGWVMLKR